MPLRTIGREVCFASQGSVFFHVRSAAIPKESCWPIPVPPGPEAVYFVAADVTSALEQTSLHFSSSSRFPGTGASRVKQINLNLSDILLILAIMSSLFFRSLCTYNCHPNI